MEIEEILNLYCNCEQKYSIEPHGKGWAIYWGRCEHRHGANIAHITECHRDLIKLIESKLNQK